MSVSTTTPDTEPICVHVQDNHERQIDNSHATPTLRSYADKNLHDLAEAHSDLLVIPTPHTHKDNLAEKPIYSLYPTQTNPHPDDTKQSVVHKIIAHNIVGFLGIPAREDGSAVELRIRSRFDEQEKQYFFQYMLQKVFNLTLINLPPLTDNEDIFALLLALLFTAYLRRALAQGLYKEYTRQEYNDANVKGPIDIARHIKCNIPFVGRIAYRTREHTHNNRVTHLIRHTIEYLRARGWLFDSSTDAQQERRTIIDATGNYSIQQQQKCIAHNRNIPIRHPYFTEYEPLRKLCIQILDRKGLSLSARTTDKVSGVLFDCAWLWEAYLATLLPNFTHPDNIQQTGGIPIYSTSATPKCFPDFYCTKDGYCPTVLDAKYKRYNNWKDAHDNSDLYQLITYVHILKADHGALIFPRRPQSEVGTLDTHKCPLGELKGYGGTLYKIAFPIPTYNQDSAYREFAGNMREAEKTFTDCIEEMTGTPTS